MTRFLKAENMAGSVVRGLAIALSVFIHSGPLSAQPAGMSLQLSYEVEWGGVDVATATADWVFGKDSFELVARSETVGVTGSLRSYRGLTELTGRIEEGRYVPHRLSISGVSRDRTREAYTTWAPRTGTIATQRDPKPDLKKVFPLKNEHIDGAIDPFSAMLNALDHIARTGSCAGTARVYDGLRTSELTLHDLGAAVLEKDRPSAYQGRALVCGFVGRPTGGHQRKSRWRQKTPKPEDVKVFIAEVQPGLFIPVRIQADAFLGTVTARLVMPSLKYGPK